MSVKNTYLKNKLIPWCYAHPLLAAALLCLIIGALTGFLSMEHQRVLGWCCVGGCIILASVWEYLFLKKKLTDVHTGVLVWGIGFLMRLGFILRSPYTKLQHDVNYFGSDSGHAGYISYLFRESHLPDFDVRNMWQFYHPPLHHLLTAEWMRLMTMLGMKTELVYECSQVMPFTYSCLALAVFALLLKHFDIKGLPFTLTMGIMALHPTFIILAGSINNDMLSIFLMLCALLLTCKWYREQKLSTILKLALAIGLGMMAKLSAWLAAPAAAMVFLIILWKNRKQPLPYIKQYVAFGCVCVPLGLGWGIRNLVKFGVPITYIPMLSDDSPQYVGNIPVLQRLFDLSPKQFTFIYDCFVGYGQEYNEYNPIIGLLKTAVFEESVNSTNYPSVTGLGETLFWTQVLLGALALGAMVWVCFKQTAPAVPEKLALVLTYVFTMGSYISFCIAFAHTCTQSIRYATPTIYVSLIFLGLFLTKARPFFKGAAVVLSAVFMVISFMIYGTIIY